MGSFAGKVSTQVIMSLVNGDQVVVGLLELRSQVTKELLISSGKVQSPFGFVVMP